MKTNIVAEKLLSAILKIEAEEANRLDFDLSFGGALRRISVYRMNPWLIRCDIKSEKKEVKNA